MRNESMEFVSVPVPVGYVTAVYELIARLDAAEQPSPDPAPSGGGVSAALTQPLVKRMYRDSEDAHRRLLEYLAARPDEWLDSQSLADGLGLPFGRKSLAGSLGAFGRRADHRYGGLKPFESHWDPEQYLVQLRMSQEVAAWIKAAAAS